MRKRLRRVTELFKIVNTPCENHEDIDDVLRSYLAFTSEHKGMRRDMVGRDEQGMADVLKRST